MPGLVFLPASSGPSPAVCLRPCWISPLSQTSASAPSEANLYDFEAMFHHGIHQPLRTERSKWFAQLFLRTLHLLPQNQCSDEVTQATKGSQPLAATSLSSDPRINCYSSALIMRPQSSTSLTLKRQGSNAPSLVRSRAISSRGSGPTETRRSTLLATGS